MRRSREDGFVLIVVVWVLAMLSLIALSYGKAAMLDRRAAAQMLTQMQAQYLARAAAERGIVELRNREALDAWYSSYGDLAPAHNWFFLKTDLASEADTFSITQSQDYNAEKDQLYFALYDEGGLINVNAIKSDVLDKVPGLSPGAVREINFRRDKSDGKSSRKRPFRTLEEIRALNDVKDADWFGRDDKPGLRDVLTVWGVAKVNVNSAPLAVLKCLPHLEERTIEAIAQYRAGPDRELGTEDDRTFANIADMKEKLKLNSDESRPIQDYCMFNSRFFRITGVATLRAGTVTATVTAVVNVTTRDATVLEWREGPLGS